MPNYQLPITKKTMSQRNEWGVIKGILLFFFVNTLAVLLILLISILIHLNYGGLAFFLPAAIGIGGFFLWQLLYVIPICIWLKRKGNKLIAKGVIIGAVITALLNIGYVLFLIYK